MNKNLKNKVSFEVQSKQFIEMGLKLCGLDDKYTIVTSHLLPNKEFYGYGVVNKNYYQARENIEGLLESDSNFLEGANDMYILEWNCDELKELSLAKIVNQVTMLDNAYKHSIFYQFEDMENYEGLYLDVDVLEDEESAVFICEATEVLVNVDYQMEDEHGNILYRYDVLPNHTIKCGWQVSNKEIVTCKHNFN